MFLSKISHFITHILFVLPFWLPWIMSTEERAWGSSEGTAPREDFIYPDTPSRELPWALYSHSPNSASYNLKHGISDLAWHRHEGQLKLYTATKDGTKLTIVADSDKFVGFMEHISWWKRSVNQKYETELKIKIALSYLLFSDTCKCFTGVVKNVHPLT